MDRTLRGFGWYLSEEGLALCKKTCEETNRRDLTQAAMEMDLRSIAKPSLPPDINRKRQHQVAGPLVLQIQKVKNVAVPSGKQYDDSSGKRLLRLQLTDGHANISAMELEGPIEKLSPDIPPGTKVIIKGTVAVVNGFMLLKKSSMEVLGGRVESLHKKWSSMKAVPDNMGRTKGDGEEGPPQFVKLGKTGSDISRNSNTRAAAKIKDKSVEQRHQSEQRQQSPVGEVSTREKMELPPSYNIQGAGGGWSGELTRKDSTNYSPSLSKVNVKLSSQIQELSLTEPSEPCTVDIENIVPHWSGSGLSRGGQSAIARCLGVGESRHGGRSRESGRTQRPPMEDGGRERRGRKQRDSEDDYCPRERKATYLLSDFLERATKSSGGGREGVRDKEEDVFKDYIYDEQNDQYYLKGTASHRGLVDMHFSNDDSSIAPVFNRDTRHDPYPNRDVEHDEGSPTDTFIHGAGRRRGRRGSCFRGGKMEWDSQRTNRGGRDGSYEGWESGGRYEQRGMGREREGQSKGGRMKMVGEGRHAEMRDGCGPRPVDKNSWNQGKDKARHGGRYTMQSSHHSSAEHLSGHSMTAGERHYGMAERETFRGKRGEPAGPGKTRQNADNYGSNSDWERLNSIRKRDKRIHESRGREDATGGNEEARYEMTRHPYSAIDSAPNGSSHWDHLEQLHTTSVPASAVKSTKITNEQFFF